MNRRTALLLAAFASNILASGAALAGTVENLERERAIAIEALLSPNMDPAERQSSTEIARTRLVDLERMVLRDDGLRGRNTPAVRSAFENYDLSFLVHASIEKNRSLIDHWLEQVGVTTNSLMSARIGRR
ncbi:MAG: hypothetical protein OEM93_08220 [Rhodospirillales bacterium]|nr:hypothetical protein [Rhodospirillales bacterium]MDH3967325.1 hypothetical protein [Rhodospirillales bacterium]